VPALAHSPADILRRVLIALGHGTAPSAGGAWPISVGAEPDSPDQALTAYDTSGRIDGYSQVDGEAAEFHGVQVRVRGADHKAGYAKAAAVAKAMDSDILRTPVTIDGTDYVLHAATRTGGIMGLGYESPTSKRVLFTINAQVILCRA
jgi:hypothetical protein